MQNNESPPDHEREDQDARRRETLLIMVNDGAVIHLGIEMVRNGWALAHQEGMEAWQAIAREKKRGLWRGEFVAPERWRKGEPLPGE